MMKNKFWATVLVAGTMALGAASTANAQNLLTNGSFETGNFTGWQVSGFTSYTGVSNSLGYLSITAQNGKYYAYDGAMGGDAIISQTFNDTAGKTYTASGYVYGLGGTPSEVGLSLDGTQQVYINPVNNTGGWTQSFSISLEPVLIH